MAILVLASLSDFVTLMDNIPISTLVASTQNYSNDWELSLQKRDLESPNRHLFAALGSCSC